MIVILIKESVTLEPVIVMDFLLEMAFNVGAQSPAQRGPNAEVTQPV